MTESENENMFTTELACPSNFEYFTMILCLHISYILCVIFLYTETEYVQYQRQWMETNNDWFTRFLFPSISLFLFSLLMRSHAKLIAEAVNSDAGNYIRTSFLVLDRYFYYFTCWTYYCSRRISSVFQTTRQIGK